MTSMPKTSDEPNLSSILYSHDSSDTNDKRGQRIKVTLSAPRNSGDLQSESLLVQDSRSQLASESSLSNIQLLSRTSQNSSIETNNKRRQSTATLISATGSSTHRDSSCAAPISPQAISPALPLVPSGLNREERENELRRIASERRSLSRKANDLADEPLEVKLPKQNPPQASKAQLQAKPPSPAIAPGQGQQQQPQQVLQQSSSSQKQLAIFINGKIRSNSIFCRSSSSNSFNSILNRFHNNTNNTSGGLKSAQDKEKLCIGDKNSPLRLCLQSKQLADKLKGQSDLRETGNKRPRRSRKGASNLDSAGKAAKLISNARNLIANYLPDSRKATPLIGIEEEVGRREKESSSRGESDSEPESSSSEPEGADENLEVQQTTTQASYKLNPSSMFLRKAMRYYRLWIYCTNITIFLGTLIFILSTIYVLSDYRIKLLVSPSSSNGDAASSTLAWLNKPGSGERNLVVSRIDNSLTGPAAKPGSQPEESVYSSYNYIFNEVSSDTPKRQTYISKGDEDEDDNKPESAKDFDIQISHTEPYVILAYIAIAIQAGVLQAIGCFGAIRMKERWIQTFWYLILALTLFDGVFLLYWLNRYDFIINSLKRNMSFRLRQNYGLAEANISAFKLQEREISGGDTSLDKIITEVLDKIQKDFQCCGISSSTDYKESRWRHAKLVQLSERLNWTTVNLNNQTEARANLLRWVPLVPASCCRRRRNAPKSSQSKPVILDDSSLPKPIRVPAWSPSMVVETIQPSKNSKLPVRTRKPHKEDGGDGDEEDEDEDEGDGDKRSSYDGSDNSIVSGADKERRYYDSTNDYNGRAAAAMQEDNINNNNEEDYNLLLSKQQRRLLAKQINFGRPDSNNLSGRRRRRRNDIKMGSFTGPEGGRWSTVDSQGRVLSWLAAAAAAASASNLTAPSEISADGGRGALNDLASLRRMLFDRAEVEDDVRDYDVYADGYDATRESYFQNRTRFSWPNRLRLTFDQYKLIEGYLLATAERAAKEATSASSSKPKRSIFSVFSGTDGHQNNNKSSESSVIGANNDSDDPTNKAQITRLKAELGRALREDPGVSCAPRGYLDQASIYTHGCQPHIRAWLDSSAHILFVTGFCVLTVLKFCSVLLLRLEIREMIHKIRVLKGMATEYNALHDLEAYLPRPSVCAQAAELTPSGVAPAVPSAGSIGSGSALLAASAMASQQPASNQHGSAHYRLGGSFSEAVVAATAAAASGTSNPGIAGSGLCTSGLASTGRAASMKAMAAVSSMLTTPEFCTARSSSAHLCTGSLLSNSGSGQHGCSLRSSDFLSQANNVMSRRHTAVSVCPSAAAAVAAAAAQHLISRRGTYIQTANSPTLNLSGLNLNQHRHSAAIPFEYQLCAAHGSSLLAPKSFAGVARPIQKENATTTATGAIEHQSSLETTGQQQPAGKSNRSPSTGSHQLLSLMYPFKRQTSGGAQSAGNFSLDLSPALITESRRSIH